MKYSDLILKILFGEDIKTSLITLLENIDANDKSIPLFEELNEALGELAENGHLKQISETQYELYSKSKVPCKFEPISKLTYENVCNKRL